MALTVPFKVTPFVVIELADPVVTVGVSISPTSKSLKLVNPVAVIVLPEIELVVLAQVLASYLLTAYEDVVPVLVVLVKSNVAE